MAEKKTKGKQKIEIKKIENDVDRMTTFSKRKSGIYKKMNELITMCNVEAALLVFSDVGSPFTFAHPSMEAITNRLTNPILQPPMDDARLIAEAYRQQHINELTREYQKLVEELDMEKEKEKKLEQLARELDLNKHWWTAPIEEMNEEEARRTRDAFVELHDNLCDLVVERMRLIGEGSSSGVEPHQLIGRENDLSIHPGDVAGGDQSAEGP